MLSKYCDPEDRSINTRRIKDELYNWSTKTTKRIMLAKQINKIMVTIRDNAIKNNRKDACMLIA